MDVSKSSIETLSESLKLPGLQEAVIHEFSNKGHKAKAKNKKGKSKVLWGKLIQVQGCCLLEVGVESKEGGIYVLTFLDSLKSLM